MMMSPMEFIIRRWIKDDKMQLMDWEMGGGKSETGREGGRERERRCRGIEKGESRRGNHTER